MKHKTLFLVIIFIYCFSSCTSPRPNQFHQTKIIDNISYYQLYIDINHNCGRDCRGLFINIEVKDGIIIGPKELFELHKLSKLNSVTIANGYMTIINGNNLFIDFTGKYKFSDKTLTE